MTVRYPKATKACRCKVWDALRLPSKKSWVVLEAKSPSPASAPAQETLARPWLGPGSWGRTCYRLPRPLGSQRVSPFCSPARPAHSPGCPRPAPSYGAHSLYLQGQESSHLRAGKGRVHCQEAEAAGCPQRTGSAPSPGLGPSAPAQPPGLCPRCSLWKSPSCPPPANSDSRAQGLKTAPG